MRYLLLLTVLLASVFCVGQSLGSGMPPGLQINGSGLISGTPSLAGTWQFTVQVSDQSSPPQTASKNFTLSIGASALTITTPSPLPNGMVNSPYAIQLSANGGSGTLSWSVIKSQPDQIPINGGPITAIPAQNATPQSVQ